jgi:predicted CoA-substrate-specific enzyme activase
MNDRCAAGTGRFLEVMATALGFTLEEFPEAALSAPRAVKINSMCTVFAESEVVSLISRGADRREVALGIHRAIVSRSAGLLKRVAPAGRIFFAGGVALNRCARILLEEETGRPVYMPPDPQIVGAIGAALSAAESAQGTSRFSLSPAVRVCFPLSWMGILHASPSRVLHDLRRA